MIISREEMLAGMASIRNGRSVDDMVRELPQRRFFAVRELRTASTSCPMTFTATLPTGPMTFTAAVAAGHAIHKIKQLCERPADPLDAPIDGVPLCALLSMDEKANRENVTAQCTRKCFTPAQRAAVSSYWSTQLRAKVDATAEADRARRPSVKAEIDDYEL